MQARAPVFVSLNNRKVKVQQWHLHADRAVLTTLVHGDAPGNELLEVLQASAISLDWDDNPSVTVRPELTHHRVAGSGPATVHRIEITLWFSDAERVAAPLSIEAKLDAILQELHLLRAEVAALRAQRPGVVSSATTPLATGQTLLDFDIEVEDDR